MLSNFNDKIDCFNGMHYYEVSDEELIEVCKKTLGNKFSGDFAIDSIRTAQEMSKIAKTCKDDDTKQYFYRSKSILIKIAIEEFENNNWKVAWYLDEKAKVVVSFVIPNDEIISLHFVDTDIDFDLTVIDEDIKLREYWIS